LAKYRKKPVVIEVIQWTGENWSEIWGLLNSPESQMRKYAQNLDGTVSIETLEGTMIANKGDFIIMGIKGEMYPCKPDIFEATYEKVEE